MDSEGARNLALIDCPDLNVLLPDHSLDLHAPRLHRITEQLTLQLSLPFDLGNTPYCIAGE